MNAVKVCFKCQQSLPLNHFYPKTPRCKTCHRDYNRDWQLRNKELLTERARSRAKQAKENRARYRQERRIEARLWVYEYLKRHPCRACGASNPTYLDFHHRDPSIKCFEIGRWLGKQYVSHFMDGDSFLGINIAVPVGHPIEPFLEEVAKCDILCKNCHAMETGKQKNTFRYRMWLLDGGGMGNQEFGVSGLGEKK